MKYIKCLSFGLHYSKSIIQNKKIKDIETMDSGIDFSCCGYNFQYFK